MWVLGRVTTYKLRNLGRFTHNQLLVTGHQVSLCTSDGGGIVCFIVNNLVNSLVIILIDYLWILNDWANIGITLGRCTRGQATKTYCQYCNCTLSTKWVLHKGCVRCVCGLVCFSHYFARYSSYSTIKSSNFRCKYWKPHVSSLIRSWDIAF